MPCGDDIVFIKMIFKTDQAWIALIIILLLSAVLLGVHYGINEISVKERITADNFSVNGNAKENNLEQTEKFPPKSPAEEYYLVKRVIDGDTIELENGERVRYIGINTSETVDLRKDVQCFGKESASANRELVEGKLVRLEKDISDKDKYGRLLRYVYQGDKFINLELVKNGYAQAYTYPPDVKNSKLFVDAQKIARENKLGLWGECL